MFTAPTLVLFTLLLAPGAGPQDPKKVAPGVGLATPVTPDAVIVQREKPAYPLTTCPVDGAHLGEAALDKVVASHLVRLCSAKCAPEVEKDPVRFRQVVVKAVVSAQKPGYPLKTCPITNEVLGEGAIDHVHGTRLVRLRDAAALAAFERSPAEPMKQVDRALIEAQRATYKPTSCPVTGEELGRGAADVLHGTRLVRLCCSGCLPKFNSAPEKYVKALDGAK